MENLISDPEDLTEDNSDFIILTVKREADKLVTFKASSNLENARSFAENDGNIVAPDDTPSIESTKSISDLYRHSNLIDRRLIHYIGKYLAGGGMRDVSAIIDDMLSEKQPAESINGYGIYKIPLDEFNPFQKKIRDLGEFSQGMKTVPDALLMAFTARFDGFLADFIRLAIRESRSPLADSDRRISPKEILSASSLDDLKDRLIDEEVEKILRDSHTDQASQIKKVCGFNPLENYERAGEYLELFERRNLVAHGIPLFNQSYQRNISKYPSLTERGKIGERVSITPSYLRNSLDILAEFCTLLEFHQDRKSKKDVNAAFAKVNVVVLDFLKQDRIILARWLAAHIFNFKSDNVNEYERKTNIIYLSTAMYLDNDVASAKSLLNGYDWSASSDMIRLQVGVLLQDFDIISEFVPLLGKSDKLTIVDIRRSPIFRNIRKLTQFNDIIEQTFGERIVKKQNQKEKSSDMNLPEN